MKRAFFWGIAAIAVFAPGSAWVAAQTAEQVREQLESAGKLPSPREVVAKLNGQPIYAEETNTLIVGQLSQAAQKPLAVMQAEALEQVINRRLLGMRIEQDNLTVTDSDIEAFIRNMRRALEARGATLEQLLQQQGVTEEQLREQAKGQALLTKFVDRYLPDSELRKYFEEHKRMFDGSEVRVSHILLRDAQNQSFMVQEKLRQDAAALREEIASGKIDFETAVKQHSVGPSRARGGDLGFIPRVGLMDPRFADAAFELEINELSEPVQSASGEHLIKVTDIRPGTKSFIDVRDDVRTAATADLNRRMVDEMRATADIEYTGAIPYVDRKSGKLVLPGQSPPEVEPESASDTGAEPTGAPDSAASDTPASPLSAPPSSTTPALPPTSP